MANIIAFGFFTVIGTIFCLAAVAFVGSFMFSSIKMLKEALK